MAPDSLEIPPSMIILILYPLKWKLGHWSSFMEALFIKGGVSIQEFVYSHDLLFAYVDG